MTPTLGGRIQTRLLVMLLIGLPLTLFWSLVFFTGKLFLIWLYVLLIGFVWDVLYVQIHRSHWDYDWPLAYQFFSGLTEGLGVFLLFWAGLLPFVVYGDGDWWRFALHYGSIWLLSYAWIFGPMRIFSLRWRFRGGELF